MNSKDCIYTRDVARGGAEGALALADQLTLFKPGAQIVPLILLLAPRIQKAIYTSVLSDLSD